MFCIGLDLGKTRDHTAIAIVEKPMGGGLQLRYAERVALGTPVPMRSALIAHSNQVALGLRPVTRAAAFEAVDFT
jgi:hypothetical protein